MVTGNAEAFVGVAVAVRTGMVAAAARTLMARATPSTVMLGQFASGVITRAMAVPPEPSTTHEYGCGGGGSQFTWTVRLSGQVGEASPSETVSVMLTGPGASR